MTEEWFLREAALSPGTPLADRVLALARKAGAKFDPEPVELPELASYTHFQRPGAAEPEGHLYVPHRPGALTPLEAAEVVRRCNSWPRLREIADIPPRTLITVADALFRLKVVVAVLEGRE